MTLLWIEIVTPLFHFQSDNLIVTNYICKAIFQHCLNHYQTSAFGECKCWIRGWGKWNNFAFKENLLLQVKFEWANRKKPYPRVQQELGKTMGQTNTQRNASWRRASALQLPVGLRLHNTNSIKCKSDVNTNRRTAPCAHGFSDSHVRLSVITAWLFFKSQGVNEFPQRTTF